MAPTATYADATTADERRERVTSVFDDFLPEHNVERKEAIALLKVATLSGVDTLFLGDPGVGKTWVIEGLCLHGFADDVRLFTHLLAKDQSADEVLGPKSLAALKEDRIARIVDGFLPTAHYGYIDEVFKASPPMLNPLLDILANRVLKMGGNTLACDQLISILMSSNELPDREDLMAFRDRIGITYHVAAIKTPEGRRRVTDIQLDFQSNGLDSTNVKKLTLADIEAIRTEVAMVDVPDAVRDMMGEAQQKWLEAGHPPSQRRVGQMWKAVKATAWAAGRTQVAADDLLVCQHMAWNAPQDADSARAIIMEFASAFSRKAERLRQSLEPVLTSMDELKSQLGQATTDGEREDATNAGMKLMGTLRGIGREAKKQIEEGDKQGQDVTLTKEILARVTEANEWAEDALIGTL